MEQRFPMNTKNSPILLKILAVLLVLLFVLSVAGLNYGNHLAGTPPAEVVFDTILLAVPLVVLYFSIFLLAAAGQQRRSQGQISQRLSKFIYFTPRIAGIVVTLFVGMFAMDVFSVGNNPWEMLGAFLVHASPAIGMAIALAFAWRRPQIGFVVFLVAGIFFLGFGIRRPENLIGIVLGISGPLAVIAMLFWADWKWQKELATSS
jgi:hypothetical protein